jgi:sortase A
MSAGQLASVLLIAAAGFLLDSLYIPAKAQLAQVLISRAFARSIEDRTPIKPWHWADTWPIARLTIERLGEDTYVLAGAHGSALAFGPGHLDGSALPGTRGVSVIAGHRDTHFRFLEHLEPGDVIRLQDVEGHWSSWTVNDMEIVDANVNPALLLTPGQDTLVLVTCYPFDAVQTGGSLRYIVRSNLASAMAAGPLPLPALPSIQLQYQTSSAD